MKKMMLTIALVLAFAACTQRTTEDDKAAQLLEKIEKLNREGAYAAALDSITSLRQQFPRAVKISLCCCRGAVAHLLQNHVIIMIVLQSLRGQRSHLCIGIQLLSEARSASGVHENLGAQLLGQHHRHVVGCRQAVSEH